MFKVNSFCNDSDIPNTNLFKFLSQKRGIIVVKIILIVKCSFCIDSPTKKFTTSLELEDSIFSNDIPLFMQIVLFCLIVCSFVCYLFVYSDLYNRFNIYSY